MRLRGTRSMFQGLPTVRLKGSSYRIPVGHAERLRRQVSPQFVSQIPSTRRVFWDVCIEFRGIRSAFPGDDCKGLRGILNKVPGRLPG